MKAKWMVFSSLLVVAAFTICPSWADDGVVDDNIMFNYDMGLLGVAEEAEPVVDNILQVTLNEGDDMVQCWGAYPWDTTGQWIVYTSEREYSKEICVMKADGTGFLQLTENNSCDSHASFVPPNNDKIVFQRNKYIDPPKDYNHSAEIWIKDANDPTPASEVNLTLQHSDPARDLDSCNQKPMVSHDGQKIAFRTCEEDIWVMDIAGDGTPLRITDGSVDDATKHSWSSDNTWVLFSARDYGMDKGPSENSRIFRAEADGSGVTKLSDENKVLTLADDSTYTADWKCENWPTLSPDGKWIAFHTNYDDEITMLSVMPATGSDGDDVKHLVIQGLPDEDNWRWVCGPSSWSPDSKFIAFKMWPDGKMVVKDEEPTCNDGARILVIHVDSGRILQLTDCFDDRRMWWSPDGSKILFRDDGWEEDRDWAEGLEAGHGDDLLVINGVDKVDEFFNPRDDSSNKNTPDCFISSIFNP
jgi:Tol biopolymer transport system component